MSTAHDKPEWAQSKREKDNARRVAEGLKPKRRIMPWIVLGVIVAGVVGFVVTRPPAPEAVEEASGPVVQQLLTSETMVIAPALLQETAKVTGDLVPAQQSAVASQASGLVLSVAVRPGDAVAVDAVLGQIDRTNLELQLNQQRATADAMRAQLQSAQQQLDRTQELTRQGNASPSTLDQARSSATALAANLAALESGVQTAELALANATVHAPIGGVVSQRSVEPGQLISVGTPLFTIVNLDRMEFQASASVNSSALVQAGQKVVVSVNGISDRTFEGVVTRVNPVALAGSRTVPIYISLDNAEGRLRGGMFATGQITVLEASDTMALPPSAIREDADGKYVLKLSEGTLTRQAVVPGKAWDRGRLIAISGLEQGDVVVVAPLAELDIGDAYELIEG